MKKKVEFSKVMPTPTAQGVFIQRRSNFNLMCIKILSLITLGIWIFLNSSCKKNTIKPAGFLSSIEQTIQQDPHLLLFNAAFIRCHLDTAFSSGGPYTVFAATDSAFVKAGWPLAKIMSTSPDSLKLLIGYCIIKGKVSSNDLVGFLSQKFTSLNPQYKPQITKNYYGIFFNGNLVTQQIAASNGILNKITGLSVPPQGNLYQTIQKNPNLTFCAHILEINPVLGNTASGGSLTLDQLLQYPGDSTFRYYYITFTNMTLLLPSDSAFMASGYTKEKIDSINNVNPNFLVAGMVGYWLVENEYFTSDFLHSGFLIIPQGRFNLLQINPNAYFFIPTNGGPNGFLGIQPDGKSLYAFNYQTGVANPNTLVPFPVGQIITPNIVTSNGVIHIVNTVPSY